MFDHSDIDLSGGGIKENTLPRIPGPCVEVL